MSKAHPGGFVRIPPEIDRSENRAGKADPECEKHHPMGCELSREKVKGVAQTRGHRPLLLSVCLGGCYHHLHLLPADITPWILYSWTVDLPQ